jgi:DNA repair protein RecO (recombination protein O)
MITTTKAVVLNAIKYSDSDLIVKCYTQLGVKSFIIKGLFKKKKGKITPGFFQSLTLLEITAKYESKRSLSFVRDVNLAYSFSTIFADISKQTMVLFLAEVLTNSLREEESNPKLFTYIETALKWLDTNSETLNFHLLFLINLTKHLGFYPDKSDNGKYFDLEAGNFSNGQTSKFCISENESLLFKSLLGTNFDGLNRLNFSKKNRQLLLETIIQYYELHLPGFRKPKSLEVLKEVFK